VTGDRRAVPAGVELAVYRLVQEALTNVVKHAAGARVVVRIGYGDDVLDVEVADTGGRATTATGTGHGHGLIGLRERLAVYDVVLQAGPAPGGGWSVHARIPA
jgi:signal transduction histidine kinase